MTPKINPGTFDPYTRRRFLQTGLAMVSTIGSVPTFLSLNGEALADTNMRTTSKPGVPEDRILVVVQLSGGNDGLNTVAPYGFDEYARSRPIIRVRENDAIKLDASQGVGLNPNMAALKQLMDDKLCGIVQGVGYPNPNRSHFASMDVWHTGDTRGGRGHGWIGKALDASESAREEALSCICIGNEAPQAANGKIVKPVAFQDARLFRWAAGDLHPALRKAYAEMHEAAPAAQSSASDPTSFIYRTAMDAQVASAKVRDAVGRPSEVQFPGTQLGQQLKMVAAMIKSELPTRIYYTAMGGFDTHANQKGQHDRLLQQFSEAMLAFHKELRKSGDLPRVTTLAFSEFGRRVRQNASSGTDHGAAGPTFVFGKHVQTGLIGKHPSLSKLDEGDLIHHTDFRTIYADLLSNWMKLDAKAALGQKFKPAGVVKI